MKRPVLLLTLSLLFLLAGCGQGLPSFMRPTYPAAKYFAGTPLLPLALLIENDDPAALARGLAAAPAPAGRGEGHEGMTLVLYALMNRRKECLKTLLTHGLDPNQSTHLGQAPGVQVQPVGLAAGGEDIDLLTILLDHGGDPNSRFNDLPSLFVAIRNDRYNYLGLLLDHKADIDATDKDGRTPMMALADHNQFDQVLYLIKRGADVFKPDHHGATLAFSVQDNFVSPTLPAYHWQQEVKQLLIARGVHFPVPHPGIAFQAKVRVENAQRRTWEATTPQGRWFREKVDAADRERELAQANVYAAGGKLPAEEKRALVAELRTEQLRREAEPRFQAWYRAQPGWAPTTNDGSDMYPPSLPTLAEEAEARAREQAATANPRR